MCFCAPRILAQASIPLAVTVDNSHQESRSSTYLVFPFENESRIASLNWLGEGLSELTVERLQDRGLKMLSRHERLATLEKIGLPDSARFSHATLIRIAGEADADVVIFGRFVSDGKTVTIEARVMRISPPSLSPTLAETVPMQDLLRAHARLSWQILCEVDQKNCPAGGANRDESSFTDPPPSLRLDAFENYVRGMTGPDDETRIRLLREASRFEPAWYRPPFELGQIYFERRDCESALPWLSRVPPDRPDGLEAGFDTGVCHLLRNDAARGEAAFSGLIERSRESELKQRFPEFPELHNNLGIAHLRLTKYFEAEAEFERASALDPDEPNYFVNLGIAKLSGKQAAAAVASFERARKLDPDDKEARLLLIATLESIGRTADAAAIRAEPMENSAHATTSNPSASPSAGSKTNAQVSAQVDGGINLQDPAALGRLARMSKDLDLGYLKPVNETPASHASSVQRPRKTGEPR